MDVSSSCVEAMRRVDDRVEWYHGDAFAMPEDWSETFDLVIDKGLIGHKVIGDVGSDLVRSEARYELIIYMCLCIYIYNNNMIIYIYIIHNNNMIIYIYTPPGAVCCPEGSNGV